MSLWRKRVIGARPHKAPPPPRNLTYHELAYRFLSHHDNTVSLDPVSDFLDFIENYRRTPISPEPMPTINRPGNSTTSGSPWVWTKPSSRPMTCCYPTQKPKMKAKWIRSLSTMPQIKSCGSLLCMNPSLTPARTNPTLCRHSMRTPRREMLAL